ncbi:MAG: TIGR03757 family integrating conjugative element protein [gamma proteobacterium symbiont of Lucinoma myriamae]|nr:TIGR03757 family integrating conjugative element protein [gamma proteobacterium symbiont of Lucinoma myriamae]
MKNQLIENLVIFSMLFFLLQLAVVSAMAQSQELNVVRPEKIWIFDNNEKPVNSEQLSQNHPVQHFNLDQTSQFEQQFSLGLSGSSQVAAAQALKRIQSLTAFQKDQMRQSYTGIVTAFQMGVRQLPAIVFEYKGKQFVVYGQQQATKALQEFQQWQDNRLEK